MTGPDSRISTLRASLICFSLPLLVLAWTAPPVLAGESVKTAPAFVVKTVEGKSLKFADFKGRPVVIDFWATWCKPCRASMPHLETVHKRYEPQGLVVMGLSVDEEEPAEVRRFVQKLGVSFRIAMADERVLDLYGPVRSIPTTFFINRQGEVVRRVVGYIDEDTLDGYVKELF
jgi:thiol-disulfide isomerase/thioredoxin